VCRAAAGEEEDDEVLSVAFSPDGRRIVVSDIVVSISDATTGAHVRSPCFLFY